MADYEVILDGGGPWGIRLQGGKDFGIPLNVARVTPGSKAATKSLLAGDQILQINNTSTDGLTHMEAQNLIKSAGDRLHLLLRQGKGASLGEIKQVGAGSFAAGPAKTLYTTDVVHSAGVDHKYNAKPRAFGATNATTGGGGGGGGVKKFDPGEYARKKKEELEKYKEDQKKPVAENSDVLKMLQNTNLDEKSNPQNAGSFSRLQNQLANEGTWANEEKAFRMTADESLSDVTPGSRAVMEDIRNVGTSGLSHTGSVTGGSKSFRRLQQMTTAEDDDALPPPPPELMDGEEPEKAIQSGTFNMMQRQIDSGAGDQIMTVFNQPAAQRGQAVPAGKTFTPVNPNRNAPPTPISAIPKAPMPVSSGPKSPMTNGPNFKIGQPKAPGFKSSSQMFNQNKGPPPPAVNAGRIENPNSRQLQHGTTYPGPPQSQNNFPPPPPPAAAPPPAQYPPSRSSNSPSSRSSNSPSTMTPQSSGSNIAMPPAQEKELCCHACKQPINGPFVSAIGKTWMPECFCCSACKCSLQNQAFVEENNQLFCERCYNQYYAPKCAHCNNAIIGNCINALGKSWHPDHFVCAFCGRSFGNDGFLVDNGKPYCGKCFEDLFSVKCAKCGKAITGGEKYVEALNKNWHSECFVCTYCGVRLEGNSFFVSRGMPFCQAHKSGY